MPNRAPVDAKMPDPSAAHRLQYALDGKGTMGANVQLSSPVAT